jgi:exonuclease SbcD
MKKIWAVHFNDIHIKNGNENDIYEAIKFMVEYCVENGIKNLICGGDVFDSRSFQRLSHLQCWIDCLELFRLNEMKCYINVGNHDKSLYNKKENFIDPFKYHPSIELFDDIKTIELNGKKVTFSPFFSNDILVPMLNEHKGADVLIGHWSMEGSTYLKQVSESPINKKLLLKWNKVFLSHYHNYHKLGKDISHLPSLIQDNFGEDNLKGFTVIYEDLSYEVIKGKFKEFKKVVIDLNEKSMDYVKKLIKEQQNSSDVLRFEFTGDETKLKSLNKSIFANTGIDIKLKFDKKYDFDDSQLEMPNVIESYGKEDIENEFKSFCNNKGYDFDFGSILLKKFFDKK